MMLLKKQSFLPSLNRVVKRNMANFIIPGDAAALAELKDAPGKKIFYFTASWCPPCKKIAPIFEKLSKNHTAINFVKIDIDEFPNDAGAYGVTSVPTFFFISGAKTVSMFTGAAEPLLVEGIKGLESC